MKARHEPTEPQVVCDDTDNEPPELLDLVVTHPFLLQVVRASVLAQTVDLDDDLVSRNGEVDRGHPLARPVADDGLRLKTDPFPVRLPRGLRFQGRFATAVGEFDDEPGLGDAVALALGSQDPFEPHVLVPGRDIGRHESVERTLARCQFDDGRLGALHVHPEVVECSDVMRPRAVCAHPEPSGLDT